MRAKDLAALALLAGGIKAFKDKADKDYAELPEQKEVARRTAKSEKKDPYAVDRAATKEELSAARRKAAREELNRKDRIGGPRSPMVDRYGDPVTTGRGGFAFTEDIPESAVTGRRFKKGGMVSASKRADGIAQRGKTKGRMV